VVGSVHLPGCWGHPRRSHNCPGLSLLRTILGKKFTISLDRLTNKGKTWKKGKKKGKKALPPTPPTPPPLPPRRKNDPSWTDLSPEEVFAEKFPLELSEEDIVQKPLEEVLVQKPLEEVVVPPQVVVVPKVSYRVSFSVVFCMALLSVLEDAFLELVGYLYDRVAATTVLTWFGLFISQAVGGTREGATTAVVFIYLGLFLEKCWSYLNIFRDTLIEDIVLNQNGCPRLKPTFTQKWHERVLKGRMFGGPKFKSFVIITFNILFLISTFTSFLYHWSVAPSTEPVPVPVPVSVPHNAPVPIPPPMS